MKDPKHTGAIKSSYDLAMERLNREKGAARKLSEQQKESLAEAERKARARLAEAEILFDGQMAAARAAGDQARMAEIEAARAHRLSRLRQEGEDEKNRIRSP